MNCPHDLAARMLTSAARIGASSRRDKVSSIAAAISVNTDVETRLKISANIHQISCNDADNEELKMSIRNI